MNKHSNPLYNISGFGCNGLADKEATEIDEESEFWDFSTPDKTEEDRIVTELAELCLEICELESNKASPEELRWAKQALKKVLKAHPEVAEKIKVNWAGFLD